MNKSVILNKKIDLYALIFEKFDEVSVKLKDNFIIDLRKEIILKYGSMQKFTKNILPNKHPQLLTSTYFKMDGGKRTSIPIKFLKIISKKLRLARKEIYKNIVFFSIYSGKKHKIPRYLKLTRDTSYFFGLYLAEGKNETKNKIRFSMVNTEFKVVLFFINYIGKYFGINRNNLKYYLYDKKASDNLKKIEDYLNIGPNLINIQKPKERMRKSYIEASKDSSLHRKIVDYLKYSLLPQIIQDKILSISFFQGVSDGEGHIRNSDKKHGYIIEMYNQRVLNTIELICRKNGVIPSRTKNVLNISLGSIRNLDFDLFRYNTSRLKRFKEVKYKIKFNKSSPRNSFLDIILTVLVKTKGTDIKTSQIYLLIGNKGKANNHYYKAINKEIKYELVDRFGQGNKHNPYSYKISNKGIDKLNKLNKSNLIKIEQLSNMIKNGN